MLYFPGGGVAYWVNDPFAQVLVFCVMAAGLLCTSLLLRHHFVSYFFCKYVFPKLLYCHKVYHEESNDTSELQLCIAPSS